MTANVSFCPSCGAQRIGAFRYCTRCRFDFDSIARGGGAEISPPAGQAGAELSGATQPAANSTAGFSERQQYAHASRAAQNQGILIQVFAIGGLVVGFIVGGLLGEALSGVWFWVLPWIGAVLGWFFGGRLGLSIWASRG